MNNTQNKSSNKIHLNSFGNKIMININEKEFQAIYASVHTGSVSSFYKADPKIKDIQGFIRIPDVTQCNAIFFTSHQFSDYPFIHVMHAPPGCFPSDIDGSDRGTIDTSIQKLIDEIKKYISIPKMRIEFDLTIVGKNINPKRGYYLTNILNKLNNVSKCNLKIFDVGSKYIISNWDICEIRGGFGNVISQSTHKYLDIDYYVSRYLGIQVSGYTNQGPNKEWFDLNIE